LKLVISNLALINFAQSWVRLYRALILVESKALKQAHSKLQNCFSNAAIG